MKGFIGWLRKQPQYSDLANDADAPGSLKGLIVEMSDCGACDGAWSMLYDALNNCPLTPPRGWYREAFAPAVPDHCKQAVVLCYAGVWADTPAMDDKTFDGWCEWVSDGWSGSPSWTEHTIDELKCSSMQVCKLWSLRGAGG